MKNRKIARRMAVQFLFQIEFQRDDIKEQAENFLESLGEENFDKDYFFEVINGVLNSQEEIDTLIANQSKDWPINRIAKVDLAILRVSVYELKHRDDIPVSVSINEAVELAKTFATSKSGKFINGILGQICKG